MGKVQQLTYAARDVNILYSKRNNSPQMTRRTDEIVVVVHGTFAENAAWWQPEGTFCRLLDAKLARLGSEARCWSAGHPHFRWSGLNSETARREASFRLAQYLAELSLRTNGAKIHLVAHSHGGN